MRRYPERGGSPLGRRGILAGRARSRPAVWGGWGKGGGVLSVEPFDRHTARAAFALGGDLRFRCVRCGRVHTAARTRAWRRCANEVAREWGLLCHGLRQEGMLPPSLLAAVYARVGSPPDYFAPPGSVSSLTWAALDRARPRFAYLAGCWPELLSLDARELGAVVGAAWEEWWEGVAAWLSRARTLLERLPEAGKPPPLKGPDWRAVIRGELVGYVEPEGPVERGREAAAVAYHVRGREEIVEVALRPHNRDAWLTVVSRRGCLRKGLWRDARWVLARFEGEG